MSGYDWELHSDQNVTWGNDEYIQVVVSDAPEYSGPYEVTPSADAQTLVTSGMVMTGNVTVNPIPNNWGLIGWNGAVLTVS